MTAPTAVPAPTVPAAPLALRRWVREMAAVLEPDAIEWSDGSPAEWYRLTGRMVEEGKLIALNPEWRPGSFLARTDPDDVARVEDRTFICTSDDADAGPTNNWREAASMKDEIAPYFAGAMRGRTMYVVPFSMGPVGGPLSQLGVQLTDSAYAVLNMRIMARVGAAPLAAFTEDTAFVRGVHSVGFPLRDADGTTREDVAWPCNETKYITQFPETREIWSFGSGYGGNALLAKKCFALRIASAMGREEGWLAEHMLLIRIVSPEGRRYHVAAAFPSACGKTNLAMMQPAIPGWRVETLGDDITWMKKGEDGRLWAMNPETGFFGVAPGTGQSSNPNAVHTLWGNTIFTNVALREDGDVWWEGLTDETPERLTDWRGEPWTPASGTPAAHPNARFTAPALQCPSLSEDWDSFEGVPLDAIVFGGRRASNVPLVTQATSWQHGVFMGATIASEKTAAAEGTVGELRRDPFAMLPFCGYNMADYFAHWLSVGEDLGERAPAIFQVNWFRKGANGSFLWPGFGENARVIQWLVRRIEGLAEARPSAIGDLPIAINTHGLNLPAEVKEELFSVPVEAWLDECDLTEQFFARFGDRLPAALTAELTALRLRLLAARLPVAA
ncbi:phosphoenolpyruvate carboxykinase (GTP) [Rathayibacter sp. VKM Ac-2759]|uniref:phosphoenolpyruvate carboxykinase (GTP) n=1 Tax=Rathayibacter sp. VKM Ac-2759 TaxID=2609252 RepID=UPI001315CDBF|nr:phosphoenolpyruvate carboxykinase (GTP) [Rathayibacter sp. VKM Ac-2759]QHC68567.1 phosphoenolpyruvate carboxykinase (GTP) [Rathayibacter sp. VKM Ac-2759]